jgi:hypothetical protein
LLTSAPILRIVDPDTDFVVWMDAYKEGLGGVPSQNGHVVCYKSRNLKENEMLYATRDLKLASIVHALKMWRYFLMGKSFDLNIDHSALKYLFEKPSLNSRQSRWLEFLSGYDFNINHIRGKENKVADALSRRVHEMHATIVSMYQSDLGHRILEVSKLDQRYVDIKEALQQGMSQHKFEGYELKEDGILMYR